MIYCPNCDLVMKKVVGEFYCIKCGYVVEDYIQFIHKGRTESKPYSNWRNNFQQTKNQFEINNGRILICERYNEVLRR